MFGAFKSVDTLWHTALEYLLNNGHETGSRDGKSVEILGAAVRLTNLDANLLVHPGRVLSPLYGAGEFLWYMAGNGYGEQIAHYAPSYWRFCESDGFAYGAYGPRIFQMAGLMQRDGEPAVFVIDQLKYAMQTLRNHPESRQVIINLWRPEDLIQATTVGKKDIPCTTTLQFIQRDGILNLIVTMRSNDIWLGLPYDLFCWTTLQHFVAKELDLIPGFYHHQAGSLHLYDRNRDAAIEALTKNPNPSRFRFEDTVGFEEGRHRATKLEEEFRKRPDISDGHFSLLAEQFGRGSRWGMLVALSLMQSMPKEEYGSELWERFNEFIPEEPLVMAMAHITKQLERNRT